MFVPFLRFSENRTGAPDFMSAHSDWIAQGFADGVFFCVGSLQAAAGGAILAHGEVVMRMTRVSRPTPSSCKGS